MKTLLTAYQLEVLMLIVKGNPGEPGTPFDPLDMDQLLARVGRSPTKAAMQFTIRSLVIGELITKGSEKRRGRVRVTYVPTAAGNAIGTPPPPTPAFFEPEPGSVEDDYSEVDLHSAEP